MVTYSVPCERTSAAVAVQAALVRAVLAAELYSATGELPAYVPRRAFASTSCRGHENGA